MINGSAAIVCNGSAAIVCNGSAAIVCNGSAAIVCNGSAAIVYTMVSNAHVSCTQPQFVTLVHVLCACCHCIHIFVQCTLHVLTKLLCDTCVVTQ